MNTPFEEPEDRASLHGHVDLEVAEVLQTAADAGDPFAAWQLEELDDSGRIATQSGVNPTLRVELDADTFAAIDAHRQQGPRRTLPNSRDAEVAFLNAVFRNNAILGYDTPDLQNGWRPYPGEFFRDAHGRILATMIAMRERGEVIDFATLAIELEKIGWLDEVGGRRYLEAILRYPASDHPRAYAKTIREKKHVRDLIFAMNESIAECYDAELSVKKLLWNALLRLLRIARNIYFGARPKDVKGMAPLSPVDYTDA